MNTLTAVQPKGQNGWHYASTNSRGGHPLGHCAEHEPHPTELEARSCYSAYQRENIRLDGTSSSWHGCQVCDAPTKKHARIQGDGYKIALLCDEHLTAQHAAEVMHLNEPAGDSYQS